MIYISWLIRNEIKKLRDELTETNRDLKHLKSIRKSLLEIKCKMDKVNSLVSREIFFTLSTNVLCAVGYLCATSKPKMVPSVLSVSLMLVSIIIELITQCLTSDKIANEMELLCDELETKFVCDDDWSPINTEYNKVKVVIGLVNSKIGFKASNLFILRAATLLTITGVIISHAVILIQTDV